MSTSRRSPVHDVSCAQANASERTTLLVGPRLLLECAVVKSTLALTRMPHPRRPGKITQEDERNRASARKSPRRDEGALLFGSRRLGGAAGAIRQASRSREESYERKDSP